MVVLGLNTIYFFVREEKTVLQIQCWLRLTPCKAQIFLRVGNTLFIKIKIKCPPEGPNLEIMTFRYHKTSVFDKFFKNLQCYLMFLFLKSIVITDPSLYDCLTFSLLIHFISFQLTWPQKTLDTPTQLFTEGVMMPSYNCLDRKGYA